MRKKLKNLKRTIKTVTIGDCEQLYEASLTADLQGLGVYDVPSAVIKDLANSEVNLFRLQGRQWTKPCTIITGRMSEGPTFLRTSVIGRILGVLSSGVQGGLGSLTVEKIHVDTPFVGQLSDPHFNLGRGDNNELHRRVLQNLPITLHPALCDPIAQGKWDSRARWTIGDGFTFNGMTTTMPVCEDGLDAIAAVRNRVEALLVLLTLLNGGYRVPVEKVSVRLYGLEDAVEIMFPMRTVDILEFGMDYYYRDRLMCPGGLRAIGMEGLQKWVEWHARFRNKSILDRWLSSTDAFNSLFVVEGIGRAMLRDEGHGKKVNFVPAVRKVVDSLDLGQIVGKRLVGSLNEVNIKLVKHIGDLSEQEDANYRARSEPLSVLASFLVAYGLLRWAVGELPAAWNDSWRQEIEQAAKASSRR